MSASRMSIALKFLCAAAIFLGAADAIAREAVVTTLDGRTLSGELLSQDEVTVTLMISGIKTPIPRRSIQDIELKPEPREQYRQMRAELENDDLDGRYRLAYMMYEKKWFDLSLAELSALEREFPDSDKVRSLKTVVQSRLDRERETTNRRTTNSRAASNNNTGDGVNVVTEAPDESQLLTQEQINLIRVYEADLEAEPNITVTPDTIEKLFETYATDDRLKKDKRAFRRLAGHEQLNVLFDLQARELYGEVIIRQDAPAIKAFRTQLHQRYVLNYCATSGCHGDNSPGGLFLFRAQPNRDETVYTNFYILNQMQKAQGTMIDRDEPRRSLLLQYGLKRDAAATPHPDVPGWRPQFLNEEDQRFQVYTNIIDQLWKPAPEYGISYRPPVWQDNPPADTDDPTRE